MNKNQFIDWIKDNTPDSAVFEYPTYSIERPVVDGYEQLGNDHNGFAVMRPASFCGVGIIEITYRYTGES